MQNLAGRRRRQCEVEVHQCARKWLALIYNASQAHRIMIYLVSALLEQSRIRMTGCKYCTRVGRGVFSMSDRNPPIHQIVFYQSGIGSAHNLYSEVIDGTAYLYHFTI